LKNAHDCTKGKKPLKKQSSGKSFEFLLQENLSRRRHVVWGGEKGGNALGGEPPKAWLRKVRGGKIRGDVVYKDLLSVFLGRSAELDNRVKGWA